MVQEMERRGCKGIGGIHWDEMIIQEGIVVCKRTGELVGFESLDIPRDCTIDVDFLSDDIHNLNYKRETESSESETDSSSSSRDRKGGLGTSWKSAHGLTNLAKYNKSWKQI